jgi:hypothetical protein
VVAVSLLNGPDPPPHFKKQIFNPHYNHVVGIFYAAQSTKYFSGFGLRRKEDITWLSLKACDPSELGWRDTDG